MEAINIDMINEQISMRNDCVISMKPVNDSAEISTVRSHLTIEQSQMHIDLEAYFVKSAIDILLQDIYVKTLKTAIPASYQDELVNYTALAILDGGHFVLSNFEYATALKNMYHKLNVDNKLPSYEQFVYCKNYSQVFNYGKLNIYFDVTASLPNDKIVRIGKKSSVCCKSYKHETRYSELVSKLEIAVNNSHTLLPSAEDYVNQSITLSEKIAHERIKSREYRKEHMFH